MRRAAKGYLVFLVSSALLGGCGRDGGSQAMSGTVRYPESLGAGIVSDVSLTNDDIDAFEKALGTEDRAQLINLLHLLENDKYNAAAVGKAANDVVRILVRIKLVDIRADLADLTKVTSSELATLGTSNNLARRQATCLRIGSRARQSVKTCATLLRQKQNRQK